MSLNCKTLATMISLSISKHYDVSSPLYRSANFCVWLFSQNYLKKRCRGFLCFIIKQYLHHLTLFFWMQRNYRFFFMFVSSATLLCLYVFGICWVFILRIKDRETTSIWKAMTNYPASIVLIIYTFIAVWFVGGLTAFHLYLISKNMVKIIPLNL